MVPKRYFDFRDIRFNAMGSALAQVAIAFGLRPPDIVWKPAASTMRLICKLAALQLIVTGFCYSNTPSRVEAYAQRIPILAFLQGNPSVMNEFGFRHDIPDLGTFYSRMTLEELQAEDAARAAEVAAILQAYRDDSMYREFLRQYTPGRDPFVHEVRVHLFSRDRNTLNARHPDTLPAVRRACLAAAYSENAFLERYVPKTLARSPFILSTAKRLELAAYDDPAYWHRSRVSHQLTTRTSEGEFWVLIGALLVALALLDNHAQRKWA